METVIIEIKNLKAYKILRNLEDLDIIKVIKKTKKRSVKLSEKYSGKLPKDVAADMINYINQSRTEWEEKVIY
jgi:hypothetical protein